MPMSSRPKNLSNIELHVCGSVTDFIVMFEIPRAEKWH
mgnify:CR=1 FL=1